MKTKTIKQQEAIARQAGRNEHGPAAQLKILDERLGRGVGAKAERARLHKMLGTSTFGIAFAKASWLRS